MYFKLFFSFSFCIAAVLSAPQANTFNNDVAISDEGSPLPAANRSRFGLLVNRIFNQSSSWLRNTFASNRANPSPVGDNNDAVKSYVNNGVTGRGNPAFNVITSRAGGVPLNAFGVPNFSMG